MATKRMGMSEWLLQYLNNNTLSDQIWWINKESGIFAILWIHGSRHGYDPRKDACLFKLWAEYTGRYVVHEDDPKRWKANFRCALRSLKDIQPITGFTHNKLSCLQFQIIEKGLRKVKNKPIQIQTKDKRKDLNRKDIKAPRETVNRLINSIPRQQNKYSQKSLKEPLSGPYEIASEPFRQTLNPPDLLNQSRIKTEENSAFEETPLSLRELTLTNSSTGSSDWSVGEIFIPEDEDSFLRLFSDT